MSSEMIATEDTEKKKFEIRSTKSETISKAECSNVQNEGESIWRARIRKKVRQARVSGV